MIDRRINYQYGGGADMGAGASGMGSGNFGGNTGGDGGNKNTGRDRIQMKEQLMLEQESWLT